MVKPVKFRVVISQKDYSLKKKHKKKKQRELRKRISKESSVPKKYHEYITSPYWTERKKRYYSTHPKKCVACDSTKMVHLHHMVYGRFGDEPDDWLVALCQLCHEEYHEKYGTKDLKNNTYSFIIEKQQEGIRLWF